jgi:signal peptidase I
LKPNGFKQALFSRKSAEIFLSGPVLSELLRAVLEKGVPFRFRANGFSMSPFIKDGDVVTVSPLYGATPHLGDVVAVIQPGTERLIIHRVIEGKGSSYITKGDNITKEDGLVSIEDILGFVTKVERRGERVAVGSGAERILIAVLNQRGLLIPLMLFLRKILPLSIKRLFL